MSATPARGASHAAAEPARVEHLESRRLLSVTLTNGVLTVIGSDRSDFVRVSERDDQVVVRDSTSGRCSFDEDEIDQVVVRLGAGNDRARLTGIDVPSRIEGDAGADFLTGGNEDDTLLGGDGADRLVGNNGDDDLRGGDGNDRLEGGNGDDRLSGGDGFDRATGGPGLDTADNTTEAAFLIDDADGAANLPPGFFTDGRLIFTNQGNLFPVEHPGMFNQFLTTGRVPTSGFPTFSAKLPGYQPLPQPETFPGFVPFPQNADPFGIDATGLNPFTGVIPLDPRISTLGSQGGLEGSVGSGGLFFLTDGSAFFLRIGFADIPVGIPIGSAGAGFGSPGLFTGIARTDDMQDDLIQFG